MLEVFKFMQSPVGELKLVAGDGGLRAVLWENDPPKRVPLGGLKHDDEHPVLLETERQLLGYFAGLRQSFDLVLDPRGTPFQMAVWRELLVIPFGETLTYGEIAARIGNPKAVRAVGAAIGRNAISIISPCHRVIGSTGSLTGFAGGIDRKARLLALEAGKIFEVREPRHPT